MYEAIIRIECERPSLIKKSLEPDVKNDRYSQTEIKIRGGKVEIKVKSKKLNHLKAIINSYISLINLLIEVGRICQS